MRFPGNLALGFALLIALTVQQARAAELMSVPQPSDDSHNLPVMRERCRAELAGADPAAARASCQRAYLLGGTAEDIEILVSALVTGKKPPTMDDLAYAFLLTEAAVRIAPKEPWGYVARAQIAQRIGDPDLLEAALAHVRAIAPERAAALDAPVRHRRAMVWAGRLLFGVFLLGTALHAARQSRKTARRSVLPAVTIALLVLLISGVARAEDASPMAPIPIDDQNPALSIPGPDEQMKNPLKFGYLLQEMLARGQAAAQKGDHLAAARYYTAITKGVPTRSYGYARLCDELLALNRKDSALMACREALYKEGVTAGDYLRYVDLMVNRPDPLSADQRKELDAIVQHLRSVPDGAVIAEQARCQIALAARDRAGVLGCAASLQKLAPDDPKTLPFVWAAAIEGGHLLAARRLVARARAAGTAGPALAKMAHATQVLLVRRAAHVAIGVAVAAMLVFLARALLRKKQPPGIDGPADPVVAA